MPCLSPPHCLIELSQIVEFLSGGNGQNIMYINKEQEVQPAAIQYFVRSPLVNLMPIGMLIGETVRLISGRWTERLA